MDLIKTEEEVSKLSENSLSVEDDHKDWKKKSTIFIVSQALSIFGSSLVQYAIIWSITLNTKSGQMITIATMSSLVPQIIISIFAGVWADRYNRKMLIVLSDFITALATLFLAVVFIMGYRELWLLFVISGIRSICSGVQTPAVNAVIPQIVPKEKLAKANSLYNSAVNLIFILSPAAGGALLAVSTLENIFFIDVITAMFAVLFMLRIKIPTHSKALEARKTGYLEDIKAGFTYTKRNDFVRNLFVIHALLYFFMTPVAFLTPLMIARSFGEEVWRLTANEIIYTLGYILGSLIYAHWSGLKNPVHTMSLACITFGLFTGALGMATTFVIYLIILFLSGIGVPFFYTPITVILQEKVGENMLGRVFGMLQLVGLTALPLGMIVFGPLSDILKIEVLIIVGGVFMALLGALIFFNKGLNSIMENKSW